MERRLTIVAFATFSLCFSCSTQSKITRIENEGVAAVLSLSESNDVPNVDFKEIPKDTLTVLDDSGTKLLIMKASIDENGEMVANDVIEAARVSARFRNVAERHGKVDISFDITVPRTLHDSKWQLRFLPQLYVMEDSVSLEPIIITGTDYRRAQLRGYQQYERFLSSIITDSNRFYLGKQLEVFLKRNLPQIYKFRQDSSFVSDSVFESFYGVSEKDAVDHYTRWLMIHRNNRRISMKDKMFRKFVKAPIETEGLRLDTVMVNTDKDFVYSYIQTIATRPGLRKADVVLSGEIYEQDKLLTSLARTEALSFYISSISTLLDERERYLTKIIERKAEAQFSCNIDFETGQDVIKPDFRDNKAEISRIRSYLTTLVENKEYDLDSIVVTAYSSPEGKEELNRILSKRRSSAVAEYFNKVIQTQRDSIRKYEGVFMELSGRRQKRNESEISFVSRSSGENWEMLETIIKNDSTISLVQKERFMELLAVSDLDRREEAMKNESFYTHIKEDFYPRLRTVSFDFHLHRKDMTQDTVHTTVLDSTYMAGIAALKDRDYKKAVTLLRPYKDYNTAVAYCALDYNASAMEILESQGNSDKVEYLKALVYSRQNQFQKAVQAYLNACRINRSFVNRGNLDPEISKLIQTYNLNSNQ